MIKYLADCSDKYTQSSEKGINPISKEDCQIITKLIQLLVDTDADPVIVDIVSQWKRKADGDILLKLEMAPLEIEKTNRPNYYVDLEGESIQVSSLFSISKKDGYDIKKNQPEYLIVINETESQNIFNGNKKIKFTDWADRDICMENLRESLSTFTNIRFL